MDRTGGRAHDPSLTPAFTALSNKPSSASDVAAAKDLKLFMDENYGLEPLADRQRRSVFSALLSFP